MSLEIRSMLATRFLDNELSSVYKKSFGGLSESTDEKEGEEEKNAIAKLFAPHANAKVFLPNSQFSQRLL